MEALTLAVTQVHAPGEAVARIVRQTETVHGIMALTEPQVPARLVTAPSVMVPVVRGLPAPLAVSLEAPLVASPEVAASVAVIQVAASAVAASVVAMPVAAVLAAEDKYREINQHIIL